jgi:phosphotransferase system enzyme I (PtsP)
MIEVPSTLLTLSRILEEVDFIGIGTNDLVQYLLAADRDNAWVSRLYDPYHPAVIWALRTVAATARAAGKPCSVCGEVAGDYATALMFMGMGFTGVSVAPNFVPQIRWAVRETPFSELQDLAQYACEADSGQEVRDLLERVRVRLHGRQLAQTNPAKGESADRGSLSS